MGVEVVQSNLSVDGVGKLDIKFGCHGADEPATGDLKKHSDSNLPKDAADEWPEPAQIHSFYIVKYRALEDKNLKAKLDVAERELQKKNQARFELFEKLKTKKAERAQIRTQIHSLSVENKQFRRVMDEKKKEMEPLQNALGKLRDPSGVKERSTSICSSEDELNRLIKSYQYRIQHESIPLSEEKQILREIKLLEGTRPQVIANAAERVRIEDSMGEKDAIQDQVKSIGVDLDGVRKEKQVVFAKIKQLDEEKVAIETDIDALEEELNAVTEKRDNILDSVNGMRKQREEGNSSFYQNRTLLTKAKVLAAKKDVEAVKELSDSEDREKRARKKSGAPVDSEETIDETLEEVAEPEKVEEKIEARVPQKNKDRKEHTIRNRASHARGPDTLPKAIMKRKKATNYWVWAAPAALVVLVIIVIGYGYLS